MKYTLVEKGNPGNPSAPKKWYAQGVNAGEKTSKQLGKDIEEITALSEPDIISATTALRKVMAKSLSEGKIVRLGDFGSFQISLSSEGAESEASFLQSHITGAKIVFRPGSELREMLNNLKFEKA